MKDQKRWWTLSGAVFVLAVVLAGCNTMEGVGEDVEAAGSAVDETAEDAQN